MVHAEGHPKGEWVERETPQATIEYALEQMAAILTMWAKYKKGARIGHIAALYQMVEPLLSVTETRAESVVTKTPAKKLGKASVGAARTGSHVLPVSVVRPAFLLLATLLNVDASDHALNVGPRLLSFCFTHPLSVEDAELPLNTCRALHRNAVFAQLCLPLIVKYANTLYFCCRIEAVC